MPKTETKHTPGPWSTSFGLNDYIRILAVNGHAVAHVYRTSFDKDVALGANAKLIAAAPDLLAAAEYALDCATTRRTGDDLEAMAIKVRDLLTAAIEKATK